MPRFAFEVVIAVALFGGLAIWDSQKPGAAQQDSSHQPATTEQNAPIGQPSAPSNGPTVQSVPNHKPAASDTEKPYEDKREFWAAKLTDWLLAAFTLALVVFTGLLYRATAGLFTETAGLRTAADQQARDMKASIKAATDAAQAAVTSNQIAVANSEQQMRAYVTIQSIQMNTHRHPSTFPGTEFWRREVEGAIHTYEFTPILRNGGQTPAINATVNSTLRRFAEGVPDTFEFSDGGEQSGGVVGPHTEWYAPPVFASAGIISPDDAATWLLWGAVEYDDIFSGSARHRTEFCFRVHIKRMPVTGETWIGFIPYPRYNNVDWGCEAEFDPHENRYH